LALAHASGGGKCKRRVPYPRNGVERRSEAEVCTSEAREIRVPLRKAWFPHWRGAHELLP
jgi:hypothetical protein